MQRHVFRVSKHFLHHSCHVGTAIGLNLLFKIPPVTCIVLTALDALALFLLFPQTALRQAEQWTAVLVFAVLACFVIDLFISKPPLRSVLSGLYPTLHRDDIYSAVSLLGANVMPHNFYLHSALVAGQSSHNDKVTARRCYLNSLDIACALGLALLVNVAVLLVAASTFHSAGTLGASLLEVALNCLISINGLSCKCLELVYSKFAGVKVATLQEAHDLLEQILNSRIAPLVCARPLVAVMGPQTSCDVAQCGLVCRLLAWLCFSLDRCQPSRARLLVR